MPSTENRTVRRRTVLSGLGGAALAASVGASARSTAVTEPAAQTADEWSSYMRDARQTGYNPNASGPTDGVRTRWTFTPGDSDGQHASHPVTVDGTVFVGVEDRLWALDADDGSVRWSYDPGHSQPSDGRVQTVGVDDGTAYVGTSHGRVAAVAAAAGTARWCRQVGASDDTDEGQRVRILGLTVAEGTVFAVEDGTTVEEAVLHALNTGTGEERWTYSYGGESTANPRQPAPPAVADGTAYLVADGLVALDVETGEEQWGPRDPGHSGQTVAVVDGAVYANGGKHSETVVAVDAADGTTEWERDLAGGPMVAARELAVGDGVVYSGHSDGDGVSRAFALDAATGDLLWAVDEAPRSALALDDETLYVNNAESAVLVARNPGDGSVRWTYDEVQGASAPAVVGERVYVSSVSGVHALEPARTPTATDSETATDTETKTDAPESTPCPCPEASPTATAAEGSHATDTASATPTSGVPASPTVGVNADVPPTATGATGPGFGVLAPLAGLAGAVGYYLRGGNEADD